ncbi:MAG: 3-methyl-2-oxobutanoate hydroxymethyltransferase [Fluviicola sp.]|nr:MAG: 3-methyl-2-oxobutanoate hydroxymethyltransferase [Fluviicola sp.]
MKNSIISLLLVVPFFGVTQLEMLSTDPVECVESFFKAFHAQDTTAIKEVVHGDIVLATIKSNSNDTILVVNDIEQFYNSISSIPETVKFQEKLTEIEIRTDGILAHVWTNYTFHLNDKISHKGVNAFTLINQGGTWKIIYLVDTRRKG